MSTVDLPVTLGHCRSRQETAAAPPAPFIRGGSAYWNLKGRHIGRTIHPFADIPQIVLAGLRLDNDLSLLPDNAIDSYPTPVRLQYKVYRDLLAILPYLGEAVNTDNIPLARFNMIITEIDYGVGDVFLNDIKQISIAVVTWITDPEKGLVPPIDPTIMAGRGFNHEATGKELCPAGLDWNDPSIKSALKADTKLIHSDLRPIFLYLNGNYDPERPWRGFLRGRLLVNVFKHIFTYQRTGDSFGRAREPLSVAKVTEASIVYIAMIVRFSLGSQSTFNSNGVMAESQLFYNLLLSFLTHPNERKSVDELLAWWNEQVFPSAVAGIPAPTANGAPAKLRRARKKRTALQAIGANANW